MVPYPFCYLCCYETWLAIHLAGTMGWPPPSRQIYEQRRQVKAVASPFGHLGPWPMHDPAMLLLTPDLCTDTTPQQPDYYAPTSPPCYSSSSGTHDATISAVPHCLTTSRRLILLATAKYTMDVDPFLLPHAL